VMGLWANKTCIIRHCSQSEKTSKNSQESENNQ